MTVGFAGGVGDWLEVGFVCRGFDEFMRLFR